MQKNKEGERLKEIVLMFLGLAGGMKVGSWVITETFRKIHEARRKKKMPTCLEVLRRSMKD